MKNILIIGAGEAWKEILESIWDNNQLDFNIKWFIDDDNKKKWTSIKWIKVLGKISDTPNFIEKLNIREILICMPSAQWETIRKIIKICNQFKISFKIIPSKYELLTWEASIKWIQNIDLDDLIWRSIIKSETKNLIEYIKDKTILVSWGAWSIWSELVRQIASFKPKTLIVFDWWENWIYDLQMDIKIQQITWNIEYIIWDIKNEKKLNRIFKKYKPEIVYHAAAYKHVPLMEDNFSEAVLNNIKWTKILAEISLKYNVNRFVLVSTDKAVKPSSIMWATKRVAEMTILNLNKTNKTFFSAVRFGNVFNSRWSVVPLFQKQIARWWPITVTDKNVVRYFMTISEAVYLILQSSTFSRNIWELFLLDMWEPVKILDLAESVIRFYWYKPYKDIDIKITWLRPWEKLKEELYTNNERFEKTIVNKLFKVTNSDLLDNTFDNILDDIVLYAEEYNKKKIEECFKKLILDYKKYD